jgi:hypothetical protein
VSTLFGGSGADEDEASEVDGEGAERDRTDDGPDRGDGSGTVDTAGMSTEDTDADAVVDTGVDTAAECVDKGARKMSGPKRSAMADTLALFLVAWSGTSA